MEIKDIKSPADIKNKSIDELEDLANKIRRVLLEKASRVGGHVGPNLGFVEASIALHYVFDSPRDKFVFDVSHQCYTHKILTGRALAFVDSEHYSDVTGYTNPNESEHDLFTVGHTSTSVSLASGLAAGRNLQNLDYNVIAVIGDGSLSGGQAFEGLDVAATLNGNFIVVVNDNEMSIAENHGGIYENLKHLRVTNGTAKDNYFRSLGYEYIYVEQGNNIEQLIHAFKSVKNINRPVVVHIHTEKGRGFAPALQYKERWHLKGPFDLTPTDNASTLTPKQRYGELSYQIISKAMANNNKVVAISAATPGISGFTADRRTKHGASFIDVGIAEEQAASMSGGLAKSGMKPVWAVVSSFIQRAYDQISQDICINGLPVVITIFGGGLYGMTDVTHLGWFDIAMLSNIPGLIYLTPCCGEEYKLMLEWAIAESKFPVAVRVPGDTVMDLPGLTFPRITAAPEYQTVITGQEVAIIAVGDMLPVAMEACNLLRSKGVYPTVINPRNVSMLDSSFLSILPLKHRIVVTVENGIVDGGFGQKVAGYYGASTVKVYNLGLPKQFRNRYDVNQLAEACCLTPTSLADFITKVAI